MEAITNPDDVAKAYRVFEKTVIGDVEPLVRKLGFQGGSLELPIYWHPDVPLWVALHPDHPEGRYWCAYGNNDPTGVSMLSITCEINPHRDGDYSKCAGLFVQDDRKHVYIAHNGKIGGGKLGVGKNSFRCAWREKGNDFEDVWFHEESQNGSYIVIGRIDESELLRSLAKFVDAVAGFKRSV